MDLFGFLGENPFLTIVIVIGVVLIVEKVLAAVTILARGYPPRESEEEE